MRVPAVSELRTALASFTCSVSSFRVLETVPATASNNTTSPLFVLDSSFNPPTRAHLQIATSALKTVSDNGGSGPGRVLLLLATQNADKGVKPASFEHRLAMMSIFAHDIRAAFADSLQPAPVVDVGITKRPYFHDKAEAIESSSVYLSSGAQPEQVHLIGFDTLIRILDARYYPPEKTLAPLAPFLSKHRLRVTYRSDAGIGAADEQDAYVRDIAEGGREHEGGCRDWARRITLVAGLNGGEEIVSSTRAREAVRTGDDDGLDRMVTAGVATWIRQNAPYKK